VVTTVRTFFRDHLGSAAYITGPNVRQAYEPFGKLILTATGTKDEFTDKRYHNVTGMYYFGARWYDAEAGRFASLDPLVANAGNPQNLNASSYVRNDPANLVDPTGMFTMCSPFGTVCWGRGGRRPYSNVPGGFAPFAQKSDSPGSGPVSDGIDSAQPHSSSIDDLHVKDSDGYTWIYQDYYDFRPQSQSRLDSGSFVYGLTFSANAVASGAGAREKSVSFGRVLGNDTGFTGQRDIVIRTNLSEPAPVFGQPAAGGLDVGADATFFVFVGTPRQLTNAIVSDASLVVIELKVYHIQGGGIFSGIRGFSIGPGFGLGASSIDGSAVPTTVRITDVANPLERL